MNISPSLFLAQEQDHAFLYEVYASTRMEEVSGWGFSPTEAHSFLQMQWSMRKQSYAMQFPNAATHIIRQHDCNIGSCILLTTAETFRIIDISLLAAYRGQQIGTFIIRVIQEQAREQSLSVCLSVTPSNPALRLYERLGFTITGATEMYISMEWNPVLTIEAYNQKRKGFVE